VLGGDIGGGDNLGGDDFGGEFTGDGIGDLVDDVQGDVGGETTDASQGGATQAADDTVGETAPEPTEYAMEGYTLATLTDNNYGRKDLVNPGDADVQWVSSLSDIISVGGALTSNETAADVSKDFSSYTVNAVAETGSYTSVTEHTVFVDSADLKGVARNMKVKVRSDNLGDFAYFTRTNENDIPFIYNPDAGNAYNSAGASGDGIISGATSIAGRIGSGAMQLDGVDDVIVIADDGSVDLDTGSFTIALWVKPDAGADGDAVLSKTPKGTVSGYIVSVNGTSVSGSVGNGSFQDDTGSGAVGTSAWKHVALVGDRLGGQLYIYVDGIQQSCVALSPGTNLSNAVALLIGNDQDGNYFKGAVDDLRIYGKALTDTYISQLFNNQLEDLQGSKAGLTAHYTFEDPEMIFEQLTYAGRPVESVPTDGIYIYGEGAMNSAGGNFLLVSQKDPDGSGGTALADGSLSASGGNLTVGINYKNKRVIGSLHSDDSSDSEQGEVIFIGKVSASGDITATVFGQVNEFNSQSDAEGQHVVMESVADAVVGKVFGRDHQAVGLHGSGSNNQDLNGSNVLNWEVAAAGFKNNAESQAVSLMPATIDFDAGHVAIVSVEIADNPGDPIFYRSTDNTGINMTMNNNSGVITAGSINATGYSRSGAAVGGTVAVTMNNGTDESLSAVVSPDFYVSLITGGNINSQAIAGDSFVFAHPAEYDLSNDGNVDSTMANYPWISMGEISVSYIDGNSRLIPSHFSHYVAGIAADFTNVSNSTRNINITGTYVGPAMATYFNGNAGTGAYLQDLRGRTEMTVDFGGGPVSGSMTLSDGGNTQTHVLSVSGSISGAGSINGSITNWTINGTGGSPTASSVNGSCYNDNASNPITSTNAPSSIGGNFNARNGSDNIQGVFGGNVTNQVPSGGGGGDT
jgi:hypothetical protein